MLRQPPLQVRREANVETGVALRPQDVHIKHRVRISRRDRVRRSLLRGTSAHFLPRQPRGAKPFTRQHVHIKHRVRISRRDRVRPSLFTREHPLFLVRQPRRGSQGATITAALAGANFTAGRGRAREGGRAPNLGISGGCEFLRVSQGNHAAMRQTNSKGTNRCTSGSVSRQLGFGENRAKLFTRPSTR